MATKFDIDLLDRHLRQVQAEFDCQRHLSLLHCILRDEFGLTDEQIVEALTDGGNDRGIDAIHINRSTDPVIVNIFQTKQYQSKIAEKNFPSNEIDKILSYIHDFLNQSDAFLDSLNPALRDISVELAELFNHGRPLIRIFFCSNGTPLLPEQRLRLESSLKGYSYISTEEFHFDNLLDLVLAPQNANRERFLKASSNQIFSRSDGDVKGIIASVSASEIVKLIANAKDPSRADRALFNENIRVFLGIKNPVNKNILQSALSEDRFVFWYLNNGITIVCEEATYPQGYAHPAIRMIAPQIVNGAQTSHALLEAHQRDPSLINDVSVLVRIYETKRSDISQLVAIATNSQTRIYNRDLMSNDKAQIRIQKALELRGLYYERKRREYEDQPRERRIDALKFGQIVLAYTLRMPERARRDSDEIFSAYYDDIFTNIRDLDEIVSAWQCLREIEANHELVIAKRRRHTTNRAMRALAYANYHVLFLVSVLAQHRGINISDPGTRKTLIEVGINIVKEHIESDERGLYEIFRDPKTKERLIQLAERQDQLPEDFQLSLPLKIDSGLF
ncbi:AIPR family protein [Maricaulis salignorans]|uniref:AIPR family protein n=1 Tax=Maricaulis salignorans TaxID=144026 RepID=UPI003A926076